MLRDNLWGKVFGNKFLFPFQSLVCSDYWSRSLWSELNITITTYYQHHSTPSLSLAQFGSELVYFLLNSEPWDWNVYYEAHNITTNTKINRIAPKDVNKFDNCQAQVQSQIQVPNPKSKVQRKVTGTGADNIILQALSTPSLVSIKNKTDKCRNPTPMTWMIF